MATASEYTNQVALTRAAIIEAKQSGDMDKAHELSLQLFAIMAEAIKAKKAGNI